jgi:hypothetical protein
LVERRRDDDERRRYGVSEYTEGHMPIWRSAAAAALIGVAAVGAPTAVAIADPTGPTADPAPVPTPQGLVPPLAGIGTALAQAGSAPTGPFGLPDLSGYETNLILGQNPVPAAPGTPDPAALPSLSAFNPEYLLAQNQAPSAPGEGVLAPSLGPMPDDPGTGRIAFLRRLHEMYQGGALTGSLLGQVSADQREEVAPAPDPEPVMYPPAALPPAG